MELTAAVVRKVAKGYDRRGYDRLWLLLWESFPYALGGWTNHAAVLIVQSAASPFDALWFCHTTGDSCLPDVHCWWLAA